MLSPIKYIVRHLFRNRLISLISILGLSTGLATTIILSLYLIHHLTFDSFHVKSDRTWKVISKISDQKEIIDELGISFGVLKDAYEKYESVEKVVRVVDNYVNLFGLELVMGKDFDYDQVPDGQGFLINETAYQELFPEGGDPIGVEIEMSGPRIGPIRGIIKDYHYESLYREIGPIALTLENPYNKVLGIKLSGTNTRQTRAFIEPELLKTDPSYTLDYDFLDDAF